MRNFKSGFTIVESLVAISILVAAIIGTGSAIQSAISSSITSENQIVAYYLAQEAFEQIRNMRDENRLNGVNWLTGLTTGSASPPCAFGQACTVSPAESAIATRCPTPATCPILRQNTTTGFFGYNLAPTWSPTIFRRTIELSSIASNSPNEIAVTVTVSWTKGTINRQFKVRENLLNW